MSTRDGFQWTPATGLQRGLPCQGVVETDNSASYPDIFDVIVVGAGFAGLVSARDLALHGRKVLLLEARDRIGGRTWSSEIGGFKYEMGGTWIHWNQPHIYTLLTRYGMQSEIALSQDYSAGINCFTKKIKDAAEDISHDQEVAIFDRILNVYCDVDGKQGRKAIPFPHNPSFNHEAVAELDQLSARDRLNQIRDKLSSEELAILESFLLHMSGGTCDNMGFFDVLRWWALCGYRADVITEHILVYKLKCGTSGLALQIFKEAMASGNLTARFSSPVATIRDDGDTVNVETRDKQNFRAKKMICTIPLNVLQTIIFEPPLSPEKRAAAELGHIDMAPKVHAEVKGSELLSWSGVTYPGKGLLYAYGDGLTPNGNTHIVSFGASEVELKSSNIDDTKAAFNHFRPMEIERVVSHDWVEDEFAKGAWCMFRPGFAQRFMKELQAPQGNITFASADWADGWRGFIDGAIEQGACAAYKVAQLL